MNETNTNPTTTSPANPRNRPYCSVCRRVIYIPTGETIGPEGNEQMYAWGTCTRECARTGAILNEMQEYRAARIRGEF